MSRKILRPTEPTTKEAMARIPFQNSLFTVKDVGYKGEICERMLLVRWNGAGSVKELDTARQRDAEGFVSADWADVQLAKAEKVTAGNLGSFLDRTQKFGIACPLVHAPDNKINFVWFGRKGGPGGKSEVKQYSNHFHNPKYHMQVSLHENRSCPIQEANIDIAGQSYDRVQLEKNMIKIERERAGPQVSLDRPLVRCSKSDAPST